MYHSWETHSFLVTPVLKVQTTEGTVWKCCQLLLRHSVNNEYLIDHDMKYELFLVIFYFFIIIPGRQDPGHD